MRSRNIKPSFFKNELLGVADPFLSLVFAGLWCAADREGRLEDRPLKLKVEILPYRENIDFNGYLTELARLEFIRRYTCDGVNVIEVVNFKKHQNPHKTEKASELPAYSDSCSLTVNPPLNIGELTEAARLIPDSFNPDSRYEADASCRAKKSARPRAAVPVSEIVSFLNEKSMKSFKESTKSTRRHIAARIKEDFTVADFKAVISHKVDEWGSDPEMMPYLRPETLFGTKFEAYLQAAKAAGYSDSKGAFEVVLPTDYKPPGGVQCSNIRH